MISVHHVLPCLLALGLTLAGGISGATQAHSLVELNQQLETREQYFQPLDRPPPDFQLQDARGRTVSLHDLAGKVVVVNFIYTHCPDVCPLHAEKIASVQALVNRTPMRDRVRFVTITTDPVRDTPDVLLAYGGQHGLDPANWLFLTSGSDRPDATRHLAEAFGHRFDVGPDGLQMHGVVTHVIDREGRLRANFHGLEFSDTNLVLFLNALTNDDHAKPESSSTGDPGRPSWWARLRHGPEPMITENLQVPPVP